jgi:hypothetical protein
MSFVVLLMMESMRQSAAAVMLGNCCGDAFPGIAFSLGYGQGGGRIAGLCTCVCIYMCV